MSHFISWDRMKQQANILPAAHTHNTTQHKHNTTQHTTLPAGSVRRVGWGAVTPPHPHSDWFSFDPTTQKLCHSVPSLACTPSLLGGAHFFSFRGAKNGPLLPTTDCFTRKGISPPWE
eukprot:TRINITY_DN745_c0_g6_i1.p2 TRINITY_DN745_c0_g6~~TRINITY_DN745_c0_g6_i1.p2  ORF type:complete len:118 (+),score=0.45 TRINITY_DN745_c0_g6_i1:153-506(+)